MCIFGRKDAPDAFSGSVQCTPCRVLWGRGVSSRLVGSRIVGPRSAISSVQPASSFVVVEGGRVQSGVNESGPSVQLHRIAPFRPCDAHTPGRAGRFHIGSFPDRAVRRVLSTMTQGGEIRLTGGRALSAPDPKGWLQHPRRAGRRRVRGTPTNILQSDRHNTPMVLRCMWWVIFFQIGRRTAQFLSQNLVPRPPL